MMDLDNRNNYSSPEYKLDLVNKYQDSYEYANDICFSRFLKNNNVPNYKVIINEFNTFLNGDLEQALESYSDFLENQIEANDDDLNAGGRGKARRAARRRARRAKRAAKKAWKAGGKQGGRKGWRSTKKVVKQSFKEAGAAIKSGTPAAEVEVGDDAMGEENALKAGNLDNEVFDDSGEPTGGEGLPKWIMPVGIGVGALVLIGGVFLVIRKNKK
jgi:hypothetical protein